jgi:adenylate cyclase
MTMRHPISLKIFSVTLALLLLMVVVTWLSLLNFRQLNNQVSALSDYYLPLEQQLASVEILIRQQIVHMERLLAAYASRDPDPEFIAKENEDFDSRGINADQVVDSSMRLLAKAKASEAIDLDRVTLAVLGKQLPSVQLARQRFHAAFREYQTEADEGNLRSTRIVRNALLREKAAVDQEIRKTLDTLNQLTRDTATRAKAEEARAARLNWIITGIATALGLIFAALVTRSLVEPVKRLLGGTRAVEQGDLGVEIHVKTPDELASLADSFNTMVAGLREKKRVTETFGKYIDPRIVEGLLQNRLPAEGGERHVMTVFFSDLANFTRTCEGLTPDTAVRFLNRYFAFMAEVIRNRKGIIDKYIGDSVMAFWGPPFIEETRHAELCCLAALDQVGQLEAFRETLPDVLGVRFGLPQVEVRMGMATGEVTVGNIGSDTARGFTVIGDTVNLASRLERANRIYGTRILVSEHTRRSAGEQLAFREIDSLRVLGKTETVRVFELAGLRGELSGEHLNALETFETGLGHYRGRDWTAAETCFRDCIASLEEDRPSQVFLDRIAAFRQSPPEADWDGVWVAESK